MSNLSLKDSAKIGTAAAPGLIKAAQLPCTLSDARFMFAATGADNQKAKVYEVACREGLGYVIVAPEKAGAVPVIFDCMAMTQPLRGKPNPMTCKLADNADPAKGLSALMARSGRACVVEKGRYLGSTDDQNVYEVACREGGGYILKAAKAPSGATTATTCLAYGGNSNLRCLLLTREQQLAAVAGLIAASGKPCTMTDKRYLGSTAAHHDYFEVACSGGKGYMLEFDPAGKLAAATDCLQANDIGGGCLLSDTRQAEIAPNGPYSDLAKGTYSDLARTAGFDCAVSKYADFPPKANGAEVVELACSNRPDGGVGLFPTTGRPQVWDCLRSRAEGYTCSFSSESNVYGKLTGQLKARGASCVVNDARPYGRTSEGADLIEVSCADGGPGWVLEYPPHAAEPSGALRNCVQAAASGVGGCQLAANKAHG
ncbi:MAG TPA: hypothetical protein VKQ54_07605 [Caulobacteraceae bacterium]|nr:hypothetical protein [Caulobacteraceae bacterium]